MTEVSCAADVADTVAPLVGALSSWVAAESVADFVALSRVAVLSTAFLALRELFDGETGAAAGTAAAAAVDAAAVVAAVDAAAVVAAVDAAAVVAATAVAAVAVAVVAGAVLADATALVVAGVVSGFAMRRSMPVRPPTNIWIAD